MPSLSRRRATAAIAFALGSLPALVGAIDGDLDPAFHGDGILAILPPTAATAAAVGVLAAPDGALVTLVQARTASAISIDQWMRVTDGGAATGCRMVDEGVSDFELTGGRFDRLGRLVVAGSFLSRGYFIVARYLYPACTLDTAFGINGLLAYAPDAPVRHVEIIERPAPGPITFHHLYVTAEIGEPGATYLILARLDDSGDLDTTFGGGTGVVELSLAPTAMELSGFEVDAERRLVIGVSLRDPGGDRDFGALRLLANGSFDDSFDSDGVRRVPIDLVAGGDDQLRAISLAPDGDIALVGHVQGAAGRRAAIAVLESSGVLETEFAGDGIRGLLVAGSARTFGYAAVHQSDGLLVLAGYAEFGESPPFDSEPFAARLLPNANLDIGFGDAGVRSLDLDSVPGGDDRFGGLTLAAGRPVLSGYVEDFDEPYHALVVRLENSLIFADGFESGDTDSW